MNSIELRQKRATKIAEARTLVDKADGESRDFTDEERAQYTALMGENGKGEKGVTGGEVGKLAEAIEKSDALEAHERELSELTSDPLKPEGSHDPKVMKRAEFVKLDAAAQMKFMHDGGKTED